VAKETFCRVRRLPSREDGFVTIDPDAAHGPRILRQRSFQKVRKGHIVPAVYQRNFAINQQVAVHCKGQPGCQIRNVKTSGTRGAFYRRTRKDGSEIDDIEVSLAALEDKAQPVFVATLAGEPLTLERKNVLAQFFGVQAVRGPSFFADRADLMGEWVSQLDERGLRPEAVEQAGGDADAVRREVLDLQLSTTTRFVTMLQKGLKMGAVLGSMRWHLLDFGAPVLAYSDQPVVMWPAGVTLTEPFSSPRFAPLGAVEVRVPLSPHLGGSEGDRR
jgi:hypothetical protein